MAASDLTAPVEAPRSGVKTRRHMSPRRYFREIGWRHVVALLALAFALYPIAWILSSSINTVNTLTGTKFIPDSTTFGNYTALFQGCHWDAGVPPFNCELHTVKNQVVPPIPTFLWNSVKIAVIAATIQLALSALAAYSFARLRWRGRRVGLIAILLIQMFPQFLAFVALFLLLDTMQETFGSAVQVSLWVIAIPLALIGAAVGFLGWRSDWKASTKRNAYIVAGVGGLILLWALIGQFADTWWPFMRDYKVTLFPSIGLGTHTGLVLVYLGGSIGVNTWLLKGFMDSIPTSLDEAAKVDGATEWDIFSKIILPLARPILIVVFILTFVGLYNELLLATVLIRDVQQFTLPVGLQLLVENDYTGTWGMLSAAAVVGTTPILIIYWSLQDRIVGGLTGAVKG
jgi:ABC-type maltose transport system permease subunit